MNIDNLKFESHKIFSKLSKSDRDVFLSYGKQLSFKKGKLIFYQEGIPTGIFLLIKGLAKIYKTGLYGKDQIFYVYKKGELFGYHALLCNEKYEDSCEVLEDAEIMFFNKYDFDALLHKIPNLRSLLIQNMGHEFGVLVNTITILAQKNIRERLALYLLVLNERYEQPQKTKIEITLTRQDLANIIGTTREGLGRLLKEFREDKFIKVDKRSIELLEIDKLKQIAGLA